MQNLRLGKMEKLLQVRQGLLSYLQMVAGIGSFTISIIFYCILFLFIWCTFQTSAHNFLVSSKTPENSCNLFLLQRWCAVCT